MCTATLGKPGQIWQDSYKDTVWFYANGIAKILSLHCIAKHFHVTYDSHKSNYFTVWKFDGSPRRFIPGTHRLYFCNLREVAGNIQTTIDNDLNILSSALNRVSITALFIGKGFHRLPWSLRPDSRLK